MPKTDPYISGVYQDKKLCLMSNSKQHNGTTTTTLTTTATTNMILTADSIESNNEEDCKLSKQLHNSNYSTPLARKTEFDSQRHSSPPGHNGNSTTSSCLTLSKRYQLSATWIFILAIIMVVSIGSLMAVLDAFTYHQKDTIGCRESYMRPSYVKQDGFDSEMTRFAGKYALYLYREKGVDLSEQVTGVPVLFIPGHAGSYKQIRSIAAESAYYYYQHYDKNHDTWDQGMRNLDYFTVDFNEEFSALHGQSLLEQAEYLNDAIDYILKLYPLSRKWGQQQTNRLPDPTSVIIIGHSMGGVVARAMFMMHNYQPDTINTIITLSTPHILPPAPFDWKISKIYDDIHSFWKGAYYDVFQHASPPLTVAPANSNDLLKEVSLISITGGNLDSMVCSDSANVSPFLSPNHGFTVFSTTIPRVWTGTDHISILSCNQLVKVLSKTLLNIVDARRGPQTKPLETRMKIFKKALLSGLENRRSDGPELVLRDLMFYDLKINESQFLLPGQRLVLGSRKSNNPDGLGKNMVLLPTFEGADGFAMLTSSLVGKYEPFDLLLCNKLEKRIKGTLRIGCRAINGEIVVPVPSTTLEDIYSASDNTFMFARISFDDMNGYEFLAVLDRRDVSDSPGDEFLMVESYDLDANTRVIKKSMLDIAFNGVQLQMNPSLFSSIHIPSIQSSMLAYHVTVDNGDRCPSSPYFTSLLRQSVSSMHESKFHININQRKQIDVSIHGRTAFSPVAPPAYPYHRQQQRPYRYSGISLDNNINNNNNNRLEGLVIDLWTDPSLCTRPIKIELTIDWYGSIGRIGFRNGIMLPTFAFIVVIAVWATQIQHYFTTGVYPPFGQAMVFCLKMAFPVISLLLAAAATYQGWTEAEVFQLLNDQWQFGKWWKSYNNNGLTIVWNDILAGRTDLFFWWLPTCGLFISMGVVCVLWLILSLFLYMCAGFVTLCRRFYPSTLRLKPAPKHQQHHHHNHHQQLQQQKRQKQKQQQNDSSSLVEHGLLWFIPSDLVCDLDQQRVQRRIITTLILFSLVATCIPYQFVFLVALLVHFITCVRSLVTSWIAPPSKELEQTNRYHYLQSMLLLYVILLPFNAPILVVWIRNLSAHWFAPFSSDHSVLAIAPFMIYVEMLTNHQLMLPRISSKIGQWLTWCAFYSVVIYAFMYGIKYTHSLYFLSNQLICWLLFLQFWHSSYGRHLYSSITKFSSLYPFPKNRS